MITSLLSIRKELSSFLVSRREQYARLYLLTDEELLHLYASKTVEAISPYIQKLFPNIHKIFGATKRDGSILVQRILTHDGENIPFNSAFKERETIENIVSKIGDLLQQNVKAQILACFQAFKRGVKYDQITRDFSWQAYEIARRIMATTDLNKIAEVSSPQDQQMKLINLIIVSEDNMDKLAKMKKGATSPKLKMKFTNLYNIEFTLKISLGNIQRVQKLTGFPNTKDMLEYFSYVKHSYIKAQDDIVVNFGYQTFTYGCESFKMEEPIIYSPGCVDSFAEISSAFKSRKCILFSGLNGDGKSSRIHLFSNLLGKYLYRCQFDSDITRKHVEKLFKIIQPENNYVMHIVFRQIDFEIMSFISQEFDLQKYNNRADAIHLFLTYHNPMPCELKIQGDLMKTIYPVYFNEEGDYDKLDMKLFVENFSSVELFRSRFLILIRAFDGLFYQTGKGISQSELISVMNYSVALSREERSMMPEESLLQAFWHHFDKNCKYDLDFPLHKAVKDLYPRLEIKLTEKVPSNDLYEKIRGFLSEKNIPFSEEFVDKIFDAWCKFKEASCLVIAGPPNNMKSFLIRMLAFLNDQPFTGISNLSLHQEFICNLLSMKSKKGEMGILPSILGGDNVIAKDSVMLIFEGMITEASISLINTLTKTTHPIHYNEDSQLIIGKNVKMIIETQHLTHEDIGKLHNVSIIKIEDEYLPEFSLLKYKLKEFWGDDDKFDDFVKISHQYLSEFREFCAEYCSPLIPIDVSTVETYFINLFRGINLRLENIAWKEDPKKMQQVSFFCCLWAVFSTISSDEQTLVDDYIRMKGTNVPVDGTVFDFEIEKDTFIWEHWKKNIVEWKYNPQMPHATIFIQTIPYIRNCYFFELLLKQGKNVLLVGPRGSGKTSIVKEFLRTFHRTEYHVICIQVCHNTKPSHIFEAIIKFTEKKSMIEVQPIGGKKILLYLDDVNLDEKNMLGQALKFFAENKVWLVNGKKVKMSDVVILATEAMDEDNCPRYITSTRKSFQMFVLDRNKEAETIKLYQQILQKKFHDFEVNIKFLTLSMIKGTIGVFKDIKEFFKANDTISTQFLLNDIKKVICGVLRSHKDCHDTKFEVVQLWVHEVFRTFRDRMMTLEDEEHVISIVR